MLNMGQMLLFLRISEGVMLDCILSVVPTLLEKGKLRFLFMSKVRHF